MEIDFLEDSYLVVFKKTEFGKRKTCPVCENDSINMNNCDICRYDISELTSHYDQYEAEVDYDDMLCEITYKLQDSFSLEACNFKEFGILIIIENHYCEIGVHRAENILTISLRTKEDALITEVAQCYTEAVADFILKEIADSIPIKDLRRAV